MLVRCGSAYPEAACPQKKLYRLLETTVIAVDNNIIVYFYLSTEHGPNADRLLQQDREWIAPPIWKSEFRNSLVLYLRQQLLTIDEALSIQARAELMMSSGERAVDSSEVLRLAHASRCSAYDCEYVALAEEQGVRLVTEDKLILREFPNIAVSLANAL